MMLMKKIKYVFSFILFFVLISIILIPITYNKYKSTYNRQITLNVTSPGYTVSYYNKVPKEYARIDAPGTPGYFTDVSVLNTH